MGAWKKDLLITNDLIVKYNIKHYKEMLKNLNLNQIRNQLILPGETPVGYVWQEIGLFFKMEARDPTLDLQLMKFLFGISSDSIFYNNRKMFNSNFEKYFTLEIIYGKARGTQAIDLPRRIEKGMPKIINDLFQNQDNVKILKNYISIKKLNKLSIELNKRNKINELLKVYKIYLLLKNIGF